MLGSIVVRMLRRFTGRDCAHLAAWAACLVGFAASGASVHAITLQFDYTYDTAGFFGTAAAPSPARLALEFAGRSFTPFADNLAAIVPGGGNSWSAAFNHPSSGVFTTAPNLSVAAGVVRIFAGARNLPGGQLAEGSVGGYQNPFGAAPFVDAIVNRGQGDSTLDFAPWGGTIAFDVTQSSGNPRAWHFDVDSPPPAETYDFYTAAVHELAHVLGFGTSQAFVSDVSDNQYLGAAAQQLYGGPVPLHSGGQHFASEVTSPPFVGVQPKPSLGPSLPQSERKTFTPIDYAVMADLGWSVPAALLGLPGDLDGDLLVDGNDFLLWQRSYGAVGASAGDANGDMKVDDYDAWMIQHYFGSAAAAPPGLLASAGQVPEPGALALAALSAAGALRLVRRRGFLQPRRSTASSSTR